MVPQDQYVSLRELREKLGIKTTKKGYADCPFCNAKKLLKFTDEKDQWRCNICDAHGAVMHFFAMYYMGMDSLPSDRAGRRKVKAAMLEFCGYDTNQPPVRKTFTPPEPTGPKFPVAPDAQLHAVYSAMASLAVFQLIPEHKKELRRRGLSNAAIERNGYRTFPVKTYIPPDVYPLYDSVDKEAREKVTQKDKKKILFGLYVAKALQERGLVLDGIPGFFRFGKHWCLTYDPGILIPTRNIHGQIVIWQVRKKSGKAKYKTLSCSYEPGAVDDSVSRCHFPLGNDKLSDTVKLIFTEGPLKADVARALTNDPCAFVAIQGVGNKVDLLKNTDAFLKAGVTEIYNGLDMDRLTNPGVRKGSKSLCMELEAHGLRVIPMYWGEKYAAEQLMVYQALARLYGVTIPPHDYRLSVFDKLNIVAAALNDAGINPAKQFDGAEYWESDTKGIDDYLFSFTKMKSHSHTSRTNYIREYHQTLLKLNEQS